jgi:hypothetical protein
MRYLSLFSGIEAATVAWEQLGWEPWLVGKGIVFGMTTALPPELKWVITSHVYSWIKVVG